MKKIILKNPLFSTFFFSFILCVFMLFSGSKISAYQDKYVIYDTTVVYEDGTEFKDMGYFFSEYTGFIDGLNLRIMAKNETTASVSFSFSHILRL